jgi:hypothetical protein
MSSALALLSAAVLAAAGGPPDAAPGGPLAAARGFYQALHAGDARRAASFAAGDVQPALASFVKLSAAHRTLEAALAERFGAEAASLVGYGNKVQAEVKALLAAQEELDGKGGARVAALDGSTLATLKQVKGAWKVELDAAYATPDGQARLAREATANEEAARLVGDRVRGGKYEDPRAAIRDYQEAVAVRLGGEAPPPAPARPEEEGVQL